MCVCACMFVSVFFCEIISLFNLRYQKWKLGHLFHPMYQTVLKVGKMISRCLYTQFSQCTMAVLASGKITKSAKAEIVQTTVSKMLNFCKYPTTAQQEVIAKKITADIMHGRRDSTASGFVS